VTRNTNHNTSDHKQGEDHYDDSG